MGRYIYDDRGKFVWKYVFGSQPSEQSRIAVELGIGDVKYNEDGDGDILTLTKEDAERLREYLNKTISVNLLGNEFKTTRTQCVDAWNHMYFGNESILCGGFTDNVLDLINELMGDELNYWSMINQFIEHIHEYSYERVEFHGEY